MAISLLQDAQTRSLAAALAGIKREDVDRSLSMSPPMSANSSASSGSSMYPGLQQAAAASAFGMLSPQLLAANRQAAAAFMAAAQLPTMSTIASTLFPHHPALFGTWGAAAAAGTAVAAAAAAPHLPHLTSAQHSPPASPHSPLASSAALSNGVGVGGSSSGVSGGGGGAVIGKHNLINMTSPTSTAVHSASDLPVKKPRKLTVKKDLISPPMDVHMSDLYHSPGGPISPPSSGSSPNSTHDGPTSAASAAAGGAAHSKDPSRDKSFTCKICSRSFGYKHVLQNHERTHTGEKPFECPECHKRFTRDHHLKTHMRLHTGEKPYHCSHCDRQFVQVANLRRHLRVHTGERPYTCEICDGKFSDSNQLKSHMLVHNGEKPFECERCHMKFRRRHHLLNHKCGIQSPPTPALSPAISGDYPMNGDQKSIMGSSYGSEESMDLGIVGGGKAAATAAAAAAAAMLMSGTSTGSGIGAPSVTVAASYEIISERALSNEHVDEDENETPLDLSEDGASIGEDGTGSLRSRKMNDIRRVFRLPPPQIMHVASDMPEQTEPEDLSLHSPRSHHDRSAASSAQSPDSMMHDDIDLDELDDAATLYMRQQQQQQQLKHQRAAAMQME